MTLEMLSVDSGGKAQASFQCGGIARSLSAVSVVDEWSIQHVGILAHLSHFHYFVVVVVSQWHEKQCQEVTCVSGLHC